ncbi:hypothetical protein [Paenibacillus pinistramenti]|uniref:hypothetical protein n=1 Tax=Paenibacillus pinistramenti TaxID=1768003 RepID=UPI00193A0AC7|nr:hypothetical protein [Paenibacillus pinistramenti]
MNTSLIQNASKLLQVQLAPESGIAPDTASSLCLLSDAAQMLEDSTLPPLRSARILALYYAVRLAMQCHQACKAPDSQLARRLLDGDYLYSVYLDLALKWEEFDLIAALAPFIKKIQIKRAEGAPQDELLLQGLSRFIRTACKMLNDSARQQTLAAEAI